MIQENNIPSQCFTLEFNKFEALGSEFWTTEADLLSVFLNLFITSLINDLFSFETLFNAVLWSLSRSFSKLKTATIVNLIF